MTPQRRGMLSDAGEIRGSVLALIPGSSPTIGLIPWNHMMHSISRCYDNHIARVLLRAQERKRTHLREAGGLVVTMTALVTLIA